MRKIVFCSFLSFAACAPPQQNFAAHSNIPPYVPPSETTSQFMARQQLRTLPEEVAWAREAIRTGQRQPLTFSAVQQGFRQVLRDPESTRYRDVRTNRTTGAVCGWYNAKNAFGGYVGERPFVYYHSRNESVPQLMLSSDRDMIASISALAEGMCPSSTSRPVRGV